MTQNRCCWWKLKAYEAMFSMWVYVRERDGTCFRECEYVLSVFCVCVCSVFIGHMFLFKRGGESFDWHLFPLFSIAPPLEPLAFGLFSSSHLSVLRKLPLFVLSFFPPIPLFSRPLSRSLRISEAFSTHMNPVAGWTPASGPVGCAWTAENLRSWDFKAVQPWMFRLCCTWTAI